MYKESEDLADRLDVSVSELIFESLACNMPALKKGGNATEMACLKFLNRCSYKVEETQQKYLIGQKYWRIFFDSERKKMSTIIVKDSSLHRLYIKGAAEVIVESCKFFHSKGVHQSMSQSIKDEVLAQIDAFNHEALRTIAVAYRDLRPDECGEDHDERLPTGGRMVEEEKLTLLCLIGIRDTLRVGVKEAVDLCHSSGIQVLMVTGDNITTARTIAGKCSILDTNHANSVMKGKKFSKMLGGLLKKCTGCNKDIVESDLLKYKIKKRDEERKKKMEEKKEEKKEEEGDDDEEGEPQLEKQEQQEECPYCEQKMVVEQVKNMEVFKKEIYPHLRVLARSRPLDKLLLVSALKEL